MFKGLFLAAATGVLLAACSPPGRVSPSEYNAFALKAQEEGLWKEAEYRLRQALTAAPGDARLHNNLGVALEAQGKLAEAHDAYRKAVDLDPNKKAYRDNLTAFVEAHRWEYAPDEESGNENP